MVLVACEESQAICIAFRDLGIEAYSCDIKPCSGGHPEWHIQDDALKVLYSCSWDLVIAHPPCTYLCKAGASNIPKHPERIQLGFEAKEFFMQFYSYPGRVCVENPAPMKRFSLPPATQKIQPYMFGHPYTKETYLWLKGLPPLFATDLVVPVASWHDLNGGKEHSCKRSKTFPGIASAMARQWLPYAG